MPQQAFRVTKASIEKSRKGSEIFKLELNSSIVATQLIPYADYARKTNKLYQLTKVHGAEIGTVVGKLVSLNLEKNSYGFEFSEVVSCDVISDFQELLEKSNGKAFDTKIDIYTVLVNRKYPINSDESITLRGSFSALSIQKKEGLVVCYPNDLDETHLTIKNIELIYNQFYKDVDPDPYNPDRISKYHLLPSGIWVSSENQHKDSGRTLSSSYYSEIVIGDKLTKDHLDFVNANI